MAKHDHQHVFIQSLVLLKKIGHIQVLGRCIVCTCSKRSLEYCRVDQHHDEGAANVCSKCCREAGNTFTKCRPELRHKQPNLASLWLANLCWMSKRRGLLQNKMPCTWTAGVYTPVAWSGGRTTCTTVEVKRAERVKPWNTSMLLDICSTPHLLHGIRGCRHSSCRQIPDTQFGRVSNLRWNQEIMG